MTTEEHPFSFKALLRIVLIGVAVILAWKALRVFANILIALILATALYPLVRFLQKKLPLIVSLIIVIFACLIPIIFIAIFVVPNLIGQLPQLLNAIKTIIGNLSFLPVSVKSFDPINYIGQHTDVLASTKSIVLTVVSVIEVIFLTFYLILDHQRLLEFFLDLFPARERIKIKAVLLELARVNGQYIRGNIIISLICSAIIFLGLALLRIPFALPLAIFAGILDLLPLVGSTIGAIPALIISFAISPLKGILVLIIHLVYQQAENAIISPAIYNKVLNLSPALSFLAVIIGAGLFGIVGAFMALPFAASIPAVLKYAKDYNIRNT